MKFRSCFVSNSSSSSFVLSRDKGVSELRISVDVDINDLINTIIHNEEELKSYMLDRYEYEIDNWDKFINRDGRYESWLYDIYFKFLTIIENEKDIIILMVSSEDINIGSYIYDNGLDVNTKLSNGANIVSEGEF